MGYSGSGAISFRDAIVLQRRGRSPAGVRRDVTGLLQRARELAAGRAHVGQPQHCHTAGGQQEGLRGVQGSHVHRS